MAKDEDPIEIPGIAQRRRKLIALALALVAGTGVLVVRHVRRTSHGSLHLPAALDPSGEIGRTLRMRDIPSPPEVPPPEPSETATTALTSPADSATPPAAATSMPSATVVASAKASAPSKPAARPAPATAVTRVDTPHSTSPTHPPSHGAIVRDSPF
jgi:hypothetical protein